MTDIIHLLISLFLFTSCTNNKNINQNFTSQKLPKALPHGNITKVVDDIFFVIGTNIVTHDSKNIQASRTMTIIRENKDLTLVNSIRLNEPGLRQLEKL